VHSIITYDIILGGGIHHIVMIFLRFKNKYLNHYLVQIQNVVDSLKKKIRNFTLALTICIFFIIVCGEELGFMCN
jgi:hypothetical protein